MASKMAEAALVPLTCGKLSFSYRVQGTIDIIVANENMQHSETRSARKHAKRAYLRTRAYVRCHRIYHACIRENI